MADKVKHLEIHQLESYEYYYDSQTVIDEDGKTLFRVYNLAECPEDAIIGRDLFDAHDYVHAVEYGMELARQGFTSIDVEVVEETHDDD